MKQTLARVVRWVTVAVVCSVALAGAVGCTAQELGVLGSAFGAYNAAVLQPLGQQQQNFQQQWQQTQFLQQQQMHDALAPNVIQ